MKVCIRCKGEKALLEFNFKFKEKGIRQAHCKACASLYIRNHYVKNRPYYLAKAKKRNFIQQSLIKTYIWEYLSKHSCIDCGESNPVVLEFDHKGDKLMAVSEIAHNNSLAQVEKEILKCEVRCANCHRKKTALQFGWFKAKLLVKQ